MTHEARLDATKSDSYAENPSNIDNTLPRWIS